MKKYFLITILLFLMIHPAIAQWDGNPLTVNNPITTTKVAVPEDHTYITSVTDGADGVIVLWVGGDSSTTCLYAMRKDDSGLLLWGDTANPKKIDTIAQQDGIRINDIAADGNGGVYIAYRKARISTDGNDIYLQHLNATGNILFARDGLKINAQDTSDNIAVSMIVDDLGVIVSWMDHISSAPYFRTFAQRYNISGRLQWDLDGVEVSIAHGYRYDPAIVSDGSHGAFIAFIDGRNDPGFSGTNSDIYAQHISSTGNRLWGDTGVVVCNAPLNQLLEEARGGGANYHYAVSDNEGGIIVNFETITDNSNDFGDFYVQRLDAHGNRLWAPGGVAVAPVTNTLKYFTNMTGDGTGGAVLLWEVHSTNTLLSITDSLVIAQHVNSNGQLAWGAAGKLIASPNIVFPSGNIYLLASCYSNIAADNAGNYIINWVTNDNGTAKILGQKFNNAGVAQWAANGINICSNPLAAPTEPYIVNSGSCMIVIWKDLRGIQPEPGIYAAKVKSSGILYAPYITNSDNIWNNPATWIGNIVPPAGADVIIKHIVTGNLSTTCGSVFIESSGHLNINAGISITVH